MRNCILAAAFSAFFFCGCPGYKKFSGRYLVVNDTGTTVTDLKISVREDKQQTWPETQPGQGWMHSQSFGPSFLVVSWSDENGSHECDFSFATKISPNSIADVCIELKPNGVLKWRIVDPPADDGKLSMMGFVIPAYVLYCLAVALLVGVPLGLAALSAYGLFAALRTAFVAIVQGVQGDRTVFQFTIREIVMLTSIVALAFGWLVQCWAMKP